MNDQPTAAPAATPTQSMRERIARALLREGINQYPEFFHLRWESASDKIRAQYLACADTALDCLTAPPSPAMVDAGMNVGGLCSGEIETTWEAMVRTMIEEGKQGGTDA